MNAKHFAEYHKSSHAFHSEVADQHEAIADCIRMEKTQEDATDKAHADGHRALAKLHRDHAALHKKLHQVALGHGEPEASKILSSAERDALLKTLTDDGVRGTIPEDVKTKLTPVPRFGAPPVDAKGVPPGLGHLVGRED